MSNEKDDIKTPASKLTDAMSGLLRAIDAVADEAAAAGKILTNYSMSSGG